MDIAKIRIALTMRDVKGSWEKKGAVRELGIALTMRDVKLDASCLSGDT